MLSQLIKVQNLTPSFHLLVFLFLFMKFYITTSIIYTNAAPHLGFALELVQADVLARYHRFYGNDVYFLTGTDENGIKNQQTAEKLGISPQEFVNQNTKKVKELIKLLNISNDDFIRTTDKKRHWPAVEKIWQTIADTGDIYQKAYEGLYCQGCEAFLSKRDLDKKGNCLVHKTPPKKIKEKNYFFRLSKYEKQLKNIIRDDKIKILPQARKQELLQFIQEGIKDVSFSRPTSSLSWGIPVPGDESQTVYVWADALTNYISALGYAVNGEKFKKYWPADIHLIGKDIVRFHALIWPGMLLSAGLPLPKTLLVHGFISSGGQKMSKSLGNVIDPLEIIRRYQTDALRYYLISEIPTMGDGDFTWEKFNTKYNADLASGLGNLTARILKMAEKYSNNSVPHIKKDPALHPLKVKFKDVSPKSGKAMKEYQIHKALSLLWQFVSEVDKYIETIKPWQLAKQEKTQELNWALYGLLDALYHLTWSIYPFLPKTSFRIAKALNIKSLLTKKPAEQDRLAHIQPGTKISTIKPIFPRL